MNFHSAFSLIAPRAGREAGGRGVREREQAARADDRERPVVCEDVRLWGGGGQPREGAGASSVCGIR